MVLCVRDLTAPGRRYRVVGVGVISACGATWYVWGDGWGWLQVTSALGVSMLLTLWLCFVVSLVLACLSSPRVRLSLSCKTRPWGWAPWETPTLVSGDSVGCKHNNGEILVE